MKIGIAFQEVIKQAIAGNLESVELLVLLLWVNDAYRTQVPKGCEQISLTAKYFQG